MTEYYENGPEGMPRVERMTRSTIMAVLSQKDVPTIYVSREEDYNSLCKFAHAVAEETLARVPAWPAERATAPATTPDTSQDWAKLDGAQAFHLIERHADGWTETGNMMESWLAARMAAAPVPIQQEPANVDNHVLTCWACQKQFTMAQRSDADGNCPHCMAEYELNEAEIEMIRGCKVLADDLGWLDALSKYAQNPSFAQAVIVTKYADKFYADSPGRVDTVGGDARDMLQPDDLKALQRFFECCEDFDSGGHDVSKERMARLHELGVVQSKGFGRHQITAFGDYVLCMATNTPASFPLKTVAEYNEDARLAHEAKIGLKPNTDCSGELANCPDNKGYGCACYPMNEAAKRGEA